MARKGQEIVQNDIEFGKKKEGNSNVPKCVKDSLVKNWWCMWNQIPVLQNHYDLNFRSLLKSSSIALITPSYILFQVVCSCFLTLLCLHLFQLFLLRNVFTLKPWKSSLLRTVLRIWTHQVCYISFWFTVLWLFQKIYWELTKNNKSTNYEIYYNAELFSCL